MVTDRKFYKTIFSVEVLSENPIEQIVDLDDLNYMITDGDCSGDIDSEGSEEIDGATAAKLLIKQGSDPGFFQLDDNGNDLTEGNEGDDGDTAPDKNKTVEANLKQTKLALAFGIMWGVGLWSGWYLTMSGVL